MGTDADGKGVDPNRVEGNWNENVGGASKTERPEPCGPPKLSFREFLTGAVFWKYPKSVLHFSDLLDHCPNRLKQFFYV